jgi:glycosyltransferase involved in cell wall biosynthesis
MRLGVADGARRARARPTRSGPVVVLDVRVVTGQGGGPDKTLINSPRYLDGTGYRMMCAYLRPPGDPGFEHIRRRAKAKGAPLIEVDDRGPLDWRVVPELLRVCRRERVAVWHAHDYKTNALGVLLRRFWPMRLVTTLHGWVEHTRRTPLYYGIDRLTLRFYERIICVSDDLYQTCRARGLPRSKLVLLENGVDLDDYHPGLSRPEAKRQLGLDPARPLVGAVGRLSDEKGFDVLVRAAGRLVSEGCDLDVMIAGEGRERYRLEGLIHSLGAGGRVRLVGFCPDLQRLYQALDVFVLSSRREGLPNVLLEAMATGLPVVATAVNGVPRLVEDRSNGVLVASESETALAAALKDLLADRHRREELGRAGLKTVEQRFSFTARMDRLRRIYDGLLGGDVT